MIIIPNKMQLSLFKCKSCIQCSVSTAYCIRGYFCGGFIFANFASQTSQKFHFNTCLFTVMETSEKSRN